jgi:hypothetical protein
MHTYRHIDWMVLYSNSGARSLMTLENSSTVGICSYLFSFSFFFLSRSTFVCILVTDLFFLRLSLVLHSRPPTSKLSLSTVTIQPEDNHIYLSPSLFGWRNTALSFFLSFLFYVHLKSFVCSLLNNISL